jgi:hypothetical protein
VEVATGRKEKRISVQRGGLRALATPAARHWFCKNLGDAMLADQALLRIQEQFASLYQDAPPATRAAVFIRHETTSHLYCQVILYFSPETSELAKTLDAEPCSPPAQEGLSMFAGDKDAVTRLFSET